MASRGLWRLMGARTRRGLALSWSALFVLSLLLQYFSFALAAPALAQVGTGLFELDGNAVDSTGAGLPDDWNRINAHTDSASSSVFITDGFNLADDIFTGGGSKDISALSAWSWKSGSVQDKDDIENAFAAAYDSAGSTYVYFGLDRYQTSGDATAGFWFLKSAVSKAANGSFNGAHVEGDVLVVLDFSNGGAVASAQIYTWHNGALTAGASGTKCDGSAQTVCAIANVATEVAPWAYDDKGAAGSTNDFPANALFEGGINLSALQLDTGCFSTFIAETRSSNSTTATLSDLAMGSFSLCAPAVIATQVKSGGTSTGSNGHITIGDSVTDTATITGTKGTATGTVEFFSCFNAASTPDCTTGGTSRGTKTLSGGVATSDAFTPTAVGEYCFRVEYNPAAGAKYLAGSHTNTTTECFVVDKKPTSISTAADQTVNLGASISDSATLAGATADATGTITFKAYGPGDSNCSNTAAFTSAAFPVSGNATYGPATFSPSTAGVYRWRAFYGGDAKNLASAGQCGDTGETDTVSKLNPSIATQASASVIVGGKIHDTATVSGGQSPTGTVTFNLYGPDDATCASPAIFTSGPIALSGASATSGDFTTTQVGTYRWRATYNGDVNNNAVTGACNATGESVAVTPRSPSITTSLAGGGKNGASITVPLGTAVHDTSTLTGATADAGGTVHYRVFTDAACTTLLTDAGTIAVVAGVPGSSVNYTFGHAGTYYWQADYSGDPNNNAASSACNLEVVTVDKAIPAISTTASATVQVGGSVSDTAHLSGGVNPTGTITFNLYGPDDANCTGAIAFTKDVTVNGNGDYGSGSFPTTAAGTYRWVASYSGDGDNAAVAGGCNDANESVVVTKKSPTVVTQASASVEVGGDIHDTATLAGGSSPTGTITFNLYGPNDTTCASAAIFTKSVTVNGNGHYDSPSFTTVTAGTYRWIANYSGDANNNATQNACNGNNESVIVTKKAPTVTTNASADVTVGGLIHDTATLAGGLNPTGTIHFALYGPNDATCAKTPIFSDDATVSGNGNYDSASYTTAQAGTYRWIANYSGDTNNASTSNVCNAANESVLANPAKPTISTVATEGGQVGDKIHDTAALTGAYQPTGTITFRLYGPTDLTCTASAIFTSTVGVALNGTATSGDFTVLLKGTYHWIASYSGDSNNTAVAGACGDAGETTVITQFAPSISTTLHSGNLSGAKITVLFGSSVTDQAVLTGASATAGGSVTYTVFSDSSCKTVFADGGTKDVTMGVVPPSDAVSFPIAGTYYWQASYSGDNANAPTTSACTDEVLTVTTPKLDVEKLVAVNNGPFVHSNTAQPGDVLHYRITIGNSGNAAATNVAVSDDIGAILAHATYNADCSNSCGFAADTLTWTIPTIAAGGSVTLTFSVTLDASFPAGQTVLPNVAVVTGPGSNCTAQSEDAACATDTTVSAAPKLNVVKLVATNGGAFGSTSIANPGDTLNYKITITNSGDADATSVPVSDDIGAILAHASYNADCNLGCSFAANTLTWTIPTIAAKGGSVTLTFSVKLDATFPGGTTHLPNTVVVTGQGSNCEADSQDPNCSTDTTVGAQPNLDVEKLVSVNDGPFVHSNSANPGDTLTYKITISNSGNAAATNVPVSDDISVILAHATFNSCSDSCTGTTTLHWTIPSIAAGSSASVTFSVTLAATFPSGQTVLPNVAVVTGPGSNCQPNLEVQDPNCATDTTVTTSALTITKGFTGNTAGTDPDLGVPAAKIGDTLHYTLTYHGEGPLTNAVITDVLPQGLAYVVGSAAGDAHFTFISYTAATRTLRWESASLLDPQKDETNTVDGAVTYDVKVLSSAPGFAQPLTNVATIDSDQTAPDSDTADVAVLAPPLDLTPPPTSTLTPQTATGNPGFALMLILLGVAGLALGIGFITPVPARVRRRDRLG